MDPTAGGAPLPPAQLVGAAAVLEDAAQALALPGSAIALTGPPGSGKSSLASRLVAMLGDRFDGVPIWLSCENEIGRRVEAADLATAILAHLGRALPVSTDPTLSIEAAKALLSDERKLLIFDDVADEGQVWDLLPSRSGSATILISRDPLDGLPIPHFELGPLPLPAAVQLLRASAGNPRELEDQALCDSLVEAAAGLPLTIRLLGSLIADGADPHQVLRQLRDETTRRSFVEPEFVTNSMRGTLAATVGSLSPQGEALLGFLSLMEEAITPSEIELELGTSPAVQDGLAELLRLGLLERGEYDSLRLHSPVRRFARERLAAEGIDAPAQQLVDAHLSSKALEALRQKAREAPSGGELSDHVEAQEYALRVAAAAGDRHGEATALANLGALYSDRGHYGDAEGAFRAALEVSEAIGDMSAAASTYLNLGNVARGQARLEEAETYYRKAREVFAQTGEVGRGAIASLLIGDLLAEAGRADDAATLYDEVHRTASPGSELATRAIASAARLAENRGDFDRALAMYESALDGEIDDVGRAGLVMHLGVLKLREGGARDAANRFDEAVVLFRRAGAADGAARASLLAGALGVAGEELELAGDRFEEAARLLGDTEESRLSAPLSFAHGLLAARRQRLAEARDFLEGALAGFRERGDTLGEALALRSLAPLIETSADREEAATVKDLANDKLAELGMEEVPPELGLIQLALRGG